MRVIARNTITEFIAQHPETRAPLEHWFRVTRAASWQTTQDVQTAFSKAKVLNAERVRFEIQGGNYRLVAAFDFLRGIAFIEFIGTHAEYDRIDALTVSMY
ncbi:type II toxin-antitoxin system HigB family toxin [Aquibaculum arenosum]|uniref:Type II toxin-antitoxin system HigB family toxin n=1 Tax=Aquibaculum arenosum TaxID=3032591 RepID=A0ABT5YLR8_9PROT|nr:type II toxin-antitoxin system HigB family toxin [Fodinicurvata sp. CAU 1616]MDF2095793.1 type II toxin-antitoxin system HigB family toxin [Fodinicurvata sp. CAU 1616]